MSKLTNALIAAGVVGFSGIAAAADYTPPAPAPACMEGSVAVPCEANKWDVGVELLYVQRTSAQNWMLGSNEKGDHRTWQQFKPKYAFGFKVEGAYHFGMGQDVTVNWTHLKKTNKIQFDADDENFSYKASIKNNFNRANLEFGQAVNYSEALNSRFHFGLSYVQLKAEDSATELGGEFIDSQESRFRGFGLRTGQRINYAISSGFGAFGEWAVSALVGSTKSNAKAFDGIDTKTASLSSRSITMGLETKAGLEYVHNMAAGDLSMYVAWQANVYQNVVQSYRDNDSVVNTDVKPSNHNWGYHGPSIGFKWVGDI